MDLARSSTPGWRWLTAACLAITACVHIAIAPAHLREAPYAGVLFIALAGAALVTATLLLTAEHRLVWLAAAMLSTAALLGYLLSRSVGLPSLGDDVGDWLNPLGVVAVAAETAVVLIAAHTQQAYRIVRNTERLYTVIPASPMDPAG